MSRRQPRQDRGAPGSVTRAAARAVRPKSAELHRLPASPLQQARENAAWWARLIATMPRGEAYLPLFEAAERIAAELEAAETASASALDRALRLAGAA